MTELNVCFKYCLASILNQYKYCQIKCSNNSIFSYTPLLENTLKMDQKLIGVMTDSAKFKSSLKKGVDGKSWEILQRLNTKKISPKFEVRIGLVETSTKASAHLLLHEFRSPEGVKHTVDPVELREVLFIYFFFWQQSLTEGWRLCERTQSGVS